MNSSKVISDEIDGATRQGHEELAKGNIEEACSSFEKAVQLAEDLKEGFTERACYFNLGACYVARGDAKRGVEFLLKAFPPEKESDGVTNYADLQYNLATAYDALGEVHEAVKYFEIAAEEYKTQGNEEMRGETLLKLGNDCTNRGEIKKAAEFYQQAAEIFQELGDKKTQLLILNNLASLLAELRDIGRCGAVLTQVIELCVEVDDVPLKGKVYNDIGLLYNGLKSYKNAAECFELAIPLMRTENPDKSLEAVLQQNLGAVYNQLKEYNKAMDCHRQAVSLHGELSNRSAQGQAFCNMGFAQSQLGDHNKAGESFSHAIQAAKDSADKSGLWQAYEGLAAVSFLKQDYDKAVENYKSALSVLSTSGDADPDHNNRIVSKLANALECQLVLAKRLNGRLPPLRLDSLKGDRSADKSERKSKRVGKTRSRQEHHQLIARGIDGDQTPSESEDSFDWSSEESSDDQEESQHEEPDKGKRRGPQGVITTEAEVHHERALISRSQKKSSTDSSVEEAPVREKGSARRSKRHRHSRKPQNTSPREQLKSTQEEHIYDEPPNDVDNSRVSGRDFSPAKSDYSDDMPRAHREAYLASVQAAKGTRSSPNGTEVKKDKESVQSRTCVIQ